MNWLKRFLHFPEKPNYEQADLLYRTALQNLDSASKELDVAIVSLQTRKAEMLAAADVADRERLARFREYTGK